MPPDHPLQPPDLVSILARQVQQGRRGEAPIGQPQLVINLSDGASMTLVFGGTVTTTTAPIKP